MTGYHLGECAFAGTVRAHNSMYLTARHGQTQTADDLLVADGDMEVFDTKLVHNRDQKYTAVRADCERDFISESGEARQVGTLILL